MGLLFLTESILFIAGLAGVYLMQIHLVQPTPYMDEVFHVRQAQHYCSGNFSTWDPKITTLPGLYLLSYAALYPISLLKGVPLTQLCTTLTLRSINVLFATSNCLLIYLLLRCHGQQRDNNRRIFTALVVSLTPVLFFFSALYYTDQASLACVLVTLLLHRHRWHQVCIAAAGASAILCRQTNVLWLLFTLGLDLEGSLCAELKPNTGLALIGSLLTRPKLCLRALCRTLLRQSAVVLVVIGFAVFVVYNGGVVVGDRAAHKVVFHLPQLFYFAVFCAMMTLPGALASWSHLISRPSHLAVCAIALPGVLAGVHWFTYVHPYTLADNRHYTFSLWRRLLNPHPTARYLLTPAYIAAGYHLLLSLHRAGHSVLWIGGFVLTAGAGLVTSPLLELRYFIVPYVVWRVASDRRLSAGWPRLVAELALVAVMNAVTVQVFLTRPFRWPGDADPVQRLMW